MNTVNTRLLRGSGASGLALVEELKRDDPYSGYKLVEKAVVS